MSEHGYPTEAEIQHIATFEGDPAEWLAYVKAAGYWWPNESWGWSEMDGPDPERWYLDKPGRIYDVSTGGWSGNEEILAAMAKNYVMWAQVWVSHRRGGHYVFQVEQR